MTAAKWLLEAQVELAQFRVYSLGVGTVGTHPIRIGFEIFYYITVFYIIPMRAVGE